MISPLKLRSQKSNLKIMNNFTLWIAFCAAGLVCGDTSTKESKIYRKLDLTTVFPIVTKIDNVTESSAFMIELLIDLDDLTKDLLNRLGGSSSSYGLTTDDTQNGLKTFKVALTKQIVTMIDQMEITVQSNVRSIDNLLKTPKHRMNQSLIKSIESRLTSIEDHLNRVHHRLRLIQAVNLNLLDTGTESSMVVTTIEDFDHPEVDRFSKSHFFIQLSHHLQWNRVAEMASKIHKLKDRITLLLETHGNNLTGEA